jgi:hypothetical protein
MLDLLLINMNRVTYANLRDTRRHVEGKIGEYHPIRDVRELRDVPLGFDISLGGTITISRGNELKCYHRYYNPNVGLKGFIGGTRKVGGETPVQNAIREFMEETGIEGLLNKFNLRNDWDNQLIFREAGFTHIGVNPADGKDVIIYNCNDLEKGILERIYHSFRRDVGYPEFRPIAGLLPLVPLLNERSRNSLIYFNGWLAVPNNLPAVLLPLAPQPVLPALHAAVNDRTIENADVAIPVSRHGGYYAKYLKYKQKYQELKEKLN